MAIFSNLNGGIEVEVIWCDQNVVEFQFKCSNNRFSGHVEIYADHNSLSEIAAGLSGFPSSQTDSRDFELGAPDANYAKGGIRLHFHCLDSVGHAVVDVKLRGDACKGLGELESVALRIPIEAAAIDTFVPQIGNMDTKQVGAKACLSMAH